VGDDLPHDDDGWGGKAGSADVGAHVGEGADQGLLLHRGTCPRDGDGRVRLAAGIDQCGGRIADGAHGGEEHQRVRRRTGGPVDLARRDVDDP
jgi:hypothetical protein